MHSLHWGAAVFSSKASVECKVLELFCQQKPNKSNYVERILNISNTFLWYITVRITCAIYHVRTFRSDPRDTYTVSYVGQTDWGGMSEHIKGVYTISDGDLMLEVNALKDVFCISFQSINKDPKPLELFCEVLKQEGIPYNVSEQYPRYLPRIKLPS